MLAAFVEEIPSLRVEVDSLQGLIIEQMTKDMDLDARELFKRRYRKRKASALDTLLQRFGAWLEMEHGLDLVEFDGHEESPGVENYAHRQ